MITQAQQIKKHRFSPQHNYSKKKINENIYAYI